MIFISLLHRTDDDALNQHFPIPLQERLSLQQYSLALPPFVFPGGCTVIHAGYRAATSKLSRHDRVQINDVHDIEVFVDEYSAWSKNGCLRA
jgi:uncharacterized protein YneR